MPFLDFKGKSIIYSHHLRAPFRSLNLDEKKSLPKKAKNGTKTNASLSDNLIIHGDNLDALKALLPRYSGKIKCIYIDPPYNTGNEGWIYNDDVNSPLIKQWLGKVVGTDDLERHDKWLCMMWPRLQLLKELLSNDGVIFVSIDDNEQHRLKMIMDEIFGEENFVCQFTWVRKKKGSFLSSEIRKMTEFVICYKKNNTKLKLYGEDAYTDKWHPIVKRTNSKKKLKIPSKIVTTTLKEGKYKKGKRGSEDTAINFLSDFTVKNDIISDEIEVEGNFTWTQDFFNEEIKRGTKISLSSKFGFNVLRYDQESKIKAPSSLINNELGIGTNEDATSELIDIFNPSIDFKYSKPASLIKFLIQSITNGEKNPVILDSFAGSGTTAQAVLELNKEDGGNRKFILVECEDYADKITAERVRRVIKGVPKSKDENLKKGLGGSFAYCKLGDEISIANMLQGKLPSYKQLAEYVFYTATGESLNNMAKANPSWFIGETSAYKLHLVYQPDVNFLMSKESALHEDLAEKIKKFNKHPQKVSLVFGPAKYITQKELLKDYNIQFCQLPYNIHKIMGA